MANITALSKEDKAKLKKIIDQGVNVSQEIADLRGSLSDTVKAVAEELQLKPAVINKAIRAAFKDTIADDRDDLDNVEELLAVAGRLPSAE